MKFFIFTETTNYGEFVKIIAARSQLEAQHILSKQNLGWEAEGEELILPTIPQEVFSGGGDNG